jgi:hypothetical protein
MLCDDYRNYLVLIIQGWGWGWYANTWQGPTTIEGNHIHHHLSLLGDGAGIYTLGPEGNLPFASDPQYGPGAVTATCHCFVCLRPVFVCFSGLSRACLGESSCFIAYVTNSSQADEPRRRRRLAGRADILRQRHGDIAPFRHPFQLDTRWG